MGFKEMVISALLVGICVFAFLTFTMISYNDNNVKNPVDNYFNGTYYNLNKSLNSYPVLTNAQKNSSFSEDATIGTTDLILYSIAGVSRNFFSIITGVYTDVLTLAQTVLGIPPLIISLFIVIIIITGIFLIWRVIKTAQ